jgi:3-hydroxyisobutyrate dehydrogenase-like beta-hydroxyacid dehydrogenase
MNIGFIGTGLMGAPMIKNLLKSKHKISIFNRTISKARKMELIYLIKLMN